MERIGPTAMEAGATSVMPACPIAVVWAACAMMDLPPARWLAPIITPHPQEGSMDDIGRLIKRLQIDPYHAVVVHAPRQAHQEAMERLFAPVGNERAADWCAEGDLQFMDGHRALGDLYKIDAFDRPPSDQTEGLDKDAVLIGTYGRSSGLQQGNIVVSEPC